MSAIPEQIAQLRRMVGEPTEATYTDFALSQYIAARSVRDLRGVSPESDAWIPTYDLNATAADIWDEKAASVADCISFSADGASYSVAERIANYNRMASKYRSRARIGSARMVSTTRELRDGVVVERDNIIPQDHNSAVEAANA